MCKAPQQHADRSYTVTSHRIKYTAYQVSEDWSGNTELDRDAEGQHTVYAEATGCPIRIIRWFFFIIRCHVIPEMPLGTIVPVLASFTAIGSIKLVKSRKLRRSSPKAQ
jgi:hypothetical protein